MINNLVVIFLIIFLYKILKNLYNLYRVKTIRYYFLTIFTNKVNNKVYETKDEILKLFKDAGVEDSLFPVTQRAGFGLVNSFEASTFKVYPSNLEIFAGAQLQMFDYSIGVYKKRIFECFSPLYWFELIIFLPKTIFEYLGLNTESIFVKFLNLIYWIVGLLFGIFKENIFTFLFSYLPKNFFNF